ncbi:MAG TPA: glycosyltransferase family 4 protein [Armatimonadota bacterium]|nr:glycosyltransferase family 4 protein [Armatimonadota bacterium]
MRILFLTQIFPYPPICGGTIRSYNILRHLGKHHHVTLVSFVRENPTQEQLDTLSELCRDIVTIPIKRSMAANLKFAALSLFSGKPFIVARDYVPDMQETVDELLQTGRFDLVYVDHLQMAQYTAGWGRCPKILDEHNVEYKIIERIAKSEGLSPKGLFAQIEWRKLRRWELGTCGKFDMVFTVTDNDKQTFSTENPELQNLVCIPIGVDFSSFSQVELDPDARDIVSIGTMSWPPNIDSILYFANEIYPLVNTKVDGVRLIVAGSNPPDEIKLLSERDNSIEVTGFVEDIRTVASRAAVFIVPLRSGSGLRVKILNALSMGLPVVSTSVGCEGIGTEAGRHLLVADTPDDFAEAVIRILSNHKLRVELGQEGREFVLANYSWDSIYKRIDAALDSLVPDKQSSTQKITRRTFPPPSRIRAK